MAFVSLFLSRFAVCLVYESFEFPRYPLLRNQPRFFSTGMFDLVVPVYGRWMDIWTRASVTSVRQLWAWEISDAHRPSRILPPSCPSRRAESNLHWLPPTQILRCFLSIRGTERGSPPSTQVSPVPSQSADVESFPFVRSTPFLPGSSRLLMCLDRRGSSGLYSQRSISPRSRLR